ncbi:MAG: 50S ribosomal protein L10 [Candidatus Eiseniibacteriota bacterium]|nr:MAG: 50S ribosomal protein L10 [Candidatus Eisenbacteria bacterium]
MGKEQKQQAVAELAEKIEAAKAIVLTDFTGMDVLTISELRRQCREAKVEYRVVKNTLTRLAARQTRFGFLADKLDGPTGLAISSSDELAPARVISGFRRRYQLPVIRLGLVEGKLVDSDEVERLALLPSKEILLGQVAGLLTAPMSKLSFALTFKLRQLRIAIEELKKRKT